VTHPTISSGVVGQTEEPSVDRDLSETQCLLLQW